MCYFTTLILLTSLEINIRTAAGDAAFDGEAGRERGAVLASHGSGRYYRVPPRSKMLGRMRGMLEYPKAEGQPRFPPQSAAGGSGAVPDG